MVCVVNSWMPSFTDVRRYSALPWSEWVSEWSSDIGLLCWPWRVLRVESVVWSSEVDNELTSRWPESRYTQHDHRHHHHQHHCQQQQQLNCHRRLWLSSRGRQPPSSDSRPNNNHAQYHHIVKNVSRILVRGVNAPLPPEAKKILKIWLRNGAFWSTEKCSLFCMFLLCNFSSIFPRGVSWPHLPLCADAHAHRSAQPFTLPVNQWLPTAGLAAFLHVSN